MDLRRRQRFLLTLTVALASSIYLPIYGQGRRNSNNPPSVQPCALELRDAPKIRGIKLGMTIGEFLELFPSARRTPTKYDPEIREESYDVFAEGEEDLAGVSINTVQFVDKKLSFVSFSYDNFAPSSAADFVRQASARLGVPATGWKAESKAIRTLTCKEFEITISTGDYGFRQENPYLLLKDNVAFAKVVARKNEKKRREIERRRREEQERRVFKP